MTKCGFLSKTRTINPLCRGMDIAQDYTLWAKEAKFSWFKQYHEFIELYTLMFSRGLFFTLIKSRTGSLSHNFLMSSLFHALIWLFSHHHYKTTNNRHRPQPLSVSQCHSQTRSKENKATSVSRPSLRTTVKCGSPPDYNRQTPASPHESVPFVEQR